MNFRRLATALFVALVVSAMFTYLLSRKMSARGAERTPDLKYVAPSAGLAAGEVLKAESLQVVTWPATNPIAGAFQKPEDLIGRSLLYPMDKGQPITDKFVTSVGAGLGLAGKVPEGMRAVSLHSDEVMGVGGFLLPGSHLDVLVTYRSERSADPMTLTVLQDAVVLAAGHQVQPDPDGKPTVATVVTLLLKPQDAERAVLASSQGAIHFVLRSGSDKDKTSTSPVTLSQISGIAAVAPVSKPVPVRIDNPVPRMETHASSAPQYVVETISGDKQSKDTFSGANSR